ncbi:MULTISPECIES: TetR/AcrR family transcriptional regulator [unclassified Arthrobacter]|uniref:TetR/AcrR family transcriptional regulator n=1 Tax=unclassified Arthrobacter TaxID=235627 RepID=UPI0009A6426F|nr:MULTISPECIES: TetR/AcrR family transcriptional regulator [unclassified Arthrobacter]MDF2050403.1 TetR/AcrR family transcriptional regulator [Arthrobacter sp. Cr_A7]SLJ93549.1 transcriptional regulator, TetR family [Arthrobacter sp. P2b]
MTTSPPTAEAAAVPSRRELNKAATRQAITDAALGLLRAKGPGNFTAEDIAEAAGISRRTFFNYFSSTDAALASIVHGFLDIAIQQLRLRPADEPMLESAQAALMALADPKAVAPLAELFTLTQQSPLMSHTELEAWDHCRAQVFAVARERVAGNRGEQDDLYIHALAGSVISCGKAAMEVWFSRRGPDLSPASLADLRQLLIDAMALLGAGFNGPQLKSTPRSPVSTGSATPTDSRSS